MYLKIPIYALCFCMQDRARRLLSKPIKFFNEMQELFINSSADGSLAMEATTCMNETHPGDDSDFNDDVCSDFSNYPQPVHDLGDDSDTLPSPNHHPSQSVDHSSSSSGLKRPQGEGVPAKRNVKPKSRTTKVVDELSATLVELRNDLKKPPPPAPMPFVNPDAMLWQRLENMTITTDQKLIVGTYLAHKDQKGMRGFLSAASNMAFESWVLKHLSDLDL